MTEAEWLTCTHPGRMLALLRGKVSARKLRLFACGFARHVDTLWAAVDCRNAVEVAERFADGSAGEHELTDARIAARLMWAAGYWVGQVAAETAEAGAWTAARAVASSLEMESIDRSYWVLQSAVLRDVFGLLPYRRGPAVNPAWLSWNGGTVPKLAADIYRGRAFGRLPLLADALEDGGCTDAELLGHLRGPGLHVRGCWAVDLLLGKE